MLPNTPLILLGGFLGCVLSVQARRPKDVHDYALRIAVSMSFAYLFTAPLCFWLRSRYDWLPKDTFVELATAGSCGMSAYVIVPWLCSAGPKLLAICSSTLADLITKTAKEKK